jgi:hypothetical protein
MLEATDERKFRQVAHAALERWHTQHLEASGCRVPQCWQRHVGMAES